MRELDAPESDRPEPLLSDFRSIRRRLQLALEGLPLANKREASCCVESASGSRRAPAVTARGHETLSHDCDMRSRFAREVAE